MIYCHLGYAAWLMSSLTRVSAIDLDINSTESIQNAATIQVTNLLSNSTIDGSVSPLSDDPFHGVKDEASVYITLLAFWDTTKNSNYNNLVIDRMDSQRPTIFNSSYNSTNTRPSTAIWGLAAMTAAEVGFPTDSSESWFNCAVNLHSKLMWKSGHFCTDGLSPDSQNLIGQQFGYLTGTYFQLTSRIAYASSGEQRRFFADRASAVWSWSVKNHILNESDWTINSLVAGMDNNTACFVLKDWRLASSYGLWLSGAAYMFKMTDTDLWKTRVEGLLDNTLTSFFTRNMIVEVGDLVDGLGAVNQARYSTEAEVANRINAKLRRTAITLAQQCGGTSNHTVCGSDWTSSVYDYAPSFGNTLNVVNILVSNLIISQTSGSVANNTENDSGAASKANDTSTGGGDSDKISDGVIASAVVGSVGGAALIIGAISWGFRKWKDQTYDAVRKDEPGKKGYTGGSQSDPADHLYGHSTVTDQVHGGLIQEVPNNGIAELHEEAATTLSSNVRHELA
ncbi:CAZyme family GH76 [Penicillium roqueforti]|uniref:CAZyme family GH76 n=1 Tax=Penicillium roqueforti TaxID=5082 RepID=UPI00190D8208|nr:CAZyme family GH76 [Penicillium roqueforti]KAF9251893.1 CAZyme family GH76 [Penicillium roqueforti]KAI2690052.1 CAZyme family GH76 [Penicillium roqueforti]KAI2702570.1 CAZyme family GH76 [Penicillium roqueforti]KAI2729466.1 CAZyme family GH76 [Penicillium roqueforti]KAI2747826.1 CAZyme family GH76 [Penicillium roqueforti]